MSVCLSSLQVESKLVGWLFKPVSRRIAKILQAYVTESFHNTINIIQVYVNKSKIMTHRLPRSAVMLWEHLLMTKHPRHFPNSKGSAHEDEWKN